MSFSLLECIQHVERGVLATILATEGHTYKKAGDKALFALDDPLPVYGNLGSLCVDQDIVRSGEEAFAAGAPRTITVDTTDSKDIHFGSGTYCAGVMTILLEPILENHKTVYSEVMKSLRSGVAVTLRHDLRSGELSLSGLSAADSEGFYIESFVAPQKLCIFGATPLAQRIVDGIGDMNIAVHVVDWRRAYLDRFAGTKDVTLHDDMCPLDDDCLVLLLSHSFERDKAALKEALASRCKYIGMLSSTTRRDQMYAALLNEGVAYRDLQRVFCPVGMPVKARSDTEIAVSIIAELIRFRNQ